MKTLQNDLTTIEQSKRLIELGVPKNSANHYYGKDSKIHYIDGTIPYSLLWETGCTPCWSAGRLMEIYELCCSKDTVAGFENMKYIHEQIPNLIEDLIGCIQGHKIMSKHWPYLYAIDFSKLEG